MAVSDPIEALVAYLKADAGVATLVGTRVFGEELPPAEAVSMPRKAVVLQASGGPSLMAGSYVKHDTVRVDAFSYGETRYQAAQLRLAVREAFKIMRRVVYADTLLHWANDAGGLVGDRDRDALWPRVFQSFQVFYAEEKVA